MGRHGRHPSDSTTDWGRIVGLVGADPFKLAEEGLADVQARSSELQAGLGRLGVRDDQRTLVNAAAGALDDERDYFTTVERQARRAIAGRSVDLGRLEKATRRYRAALGRQANVKRAAAPDPPARRHRKAERAASAAVKSAVADRLDR